ncbi:C2H2 and C2HC zinc fingers superfamily protein [Zea mays]|uniref:C2H2 and C2HC zinc fingers superfamily protein n=1 Tax=Zea mays TaxID=4577 RepID=A0A1D6MIA2_MAIZE|nr:C2H2 and C2HC zinc fingers superfamily protein [Zea mays]
MLNFLLRLLVRSRLGSRFAILFFSQRSFTICYLFSLRIFWWLQVQKRFEALKKRKDPSAFTEEDLDERIMKQQQDEEERKRQRKEKKKEKKVSAVMQHKSPPVFIFELKIITDSPVGFENQ